RRPPGAPPGLAVTDRGRASVPAALVAGGPQRSVPLGRPVARGTGDRRMVQALGPEAGRTGIVHVHSEYSHDGRDTLGHLARLSARRGIGFVGLTDHAEDLDAGRFAECLGHCAEASRLGARLIPGLEFRFAGYPGLHLLAFGLARWIEPRTPAEFLEQ